MKPEALAALREDYRQATLDYKDVGTDPLLFFQHWFQEARDAGVPEPNAMTLATADSQGRPYARVVLLKALEEQAFVFYTNYESGKGRQLAENPQAALLFFWPELEREVRIEGRVTRVDPEKSDAYFESRPRGSQLGAWASPQSQVVASRAVLEESFREVEVRFGETGVVPRPPHWGGYAVAASRIEFWQGRSSRMHDRLLFERGEQGWKVSRLAP